MKKSYKNIREFIDALDAEGELLRIDREVSPILDISKITDAESKKPLGGKALLFENVVDNGRKAFPVATNLFGSSKRMGMALGLESLDKAGAGIEELTDAAPPRSFGEFFELAKKILPLARISPHKIRGRAPCQEVVATGNDIDLSQIPVIKCWPHDGGRFVTLPLVFTKSPDGKKRNLGMYRLQIYDKSTTGMHWHIHKDGAHFFRQYASEGKRMPVAVAIGADPATIYAATAPMPRGIDELLLAGFFRKKSVPLAKCVTVDLEVPADAEFVLEGYVECDELRLEGPFGDHTGYYSLADMYPVFHLTALTRKEKPIYCATLVGPPPMEDCYMAKATERVFLPLLKTVMPEIRDYFLPWEGVFHNISVVSIDKEYPDHARKLADGLWGQGQMSFCKSIAVVGESVKPSNLAEVWRLMVEEFDPRADVFLTRGVLDALDHSSPSPLSGTKIGLDLSPRCSGETPRAKLPLKIPSQSDIDKCRSFLAEGFGEIKKFRADNFFCAATISKGERRGRDILETVANSGLFDQFFRAMAFFDSDIDVFDNSKVLWKIFNNTDPSRDIIIKDTGLCLVDACKKNRADGHLREWPDDLSFDK